MYDAANLYVGTVHLDGEEPQAIKTFEIAETLCVDVINNVAITTQHTSRTQFIDNTITNVVGGCTDVVSSMDTLFTILTNAISNDNLTGVTRTTPAVVFCIFKGKRPKLSLHLIRQEILLYLLLLMIFLQERIHLLHQEQTSITLDSVDVKMLRVPLQLFCNFD